MNVRSRRFLTLAFVLIFLVASPVVILHTLGYKYNFQKNRLEKTGIFFIKSYPKNADIYLDGQPTKKQTPNRLTRLLPKTYNVSIGQEGYFSWSKDLPVSSQKTTFIENISLFKSEFDFSQKLAGEFTGFVPSPDGLGIALLEKTAAGYQLWKYDVLTEDFTELLNLPEFYLPSVTAWSSNSRKLAVKYGLDYLILDAADPSYYNKLSKISPFNFTDVKWDFFNDNVIYGLNSRGLHKINILSRETTLLTEDEIIDFYPLPNGLIFISKNRDKAYLSLWQKEKAEPIFSLPLSDEYEFFSLNDSLLMLKDASQNQVYIIEPDNQNKPVKSFIKNLQSFNWLNNGLLYWNNSELWAYYPDSDESILLERTSQQINYAFWHPNGDYIFAVISGKLKIYELDSRDRRNVYELFDLEAGKTDFITEDEKGQELFFVGRINNEEGFYGAVIQ
ncbi:MAG TPA: PEGA domain-containing protein [Patescibacteria group bacterium]|nr:PEGA domain-containing protein [Patescibacteria group bacterium]